MKLRIGTRKSKLAMIQTEIVRDAILRKFPETEIEMVPMSTKGDLILDRSLTSFGGKGVFTGELETALLDGEIDMAVHSAKDMPMEFPEGLCIGAVLEREEAADVLVTLDGTPAEKLPAGSVIGTSSLRRQLQIRAVNPGVEVKLLRGNVQTRIEKLRRGEYDGILLAAAGLVRLGLDKEEGLHLEYLDKHSFVPAAGQGILAAEVRREDQKEGGRLEMMLKSIHSEIAAAELFAEREFLRILEGGCNAPCGAWCRIHEKTMMMTAMYARDGIHPVIFEEKLIVEEEKAQWKADKALEWEQEEPFSGGLIETAGRLAERLAARLQYKPVYLVGAGPGDGGLITRKGLECLRQADVVVYDNLISGSLLNEARLDAELIYAGKRSGKHSMRQEQIQQILVEKAMEGKSVVRLKGGDPYIFGRGGEEALALREQGIPYEVIPGVSSVYSVPAYSGIPVTHREVASSFHVITGHEGDGKQTASVDYRILAKEEGTLVFLMGLGHLRFIAEQLIKYGKDPATPAAVIENGTTAKQKKAVSDLAHIEAAVREKGLSTPALIIIGEAVEMESRLDWFGRGALAGKRILITGTRHMVSELEAELKPLGAECVAVSLIESRPLWTKETAAALKNVAQYGWLVFTSRNGVDLFFQMMRQMGQDLRTLMHVKFAAIGRGTAEELFKHGFICDFVPGNFSGAGLAKEWIPELKKTDRVLILRAKNGSPVLPQELEKAGIPFTDAPVYETWTDWRRQEELNRLAETVDYVVLASSSAAHAMKQMLRRRLPESARVIAIGPVTAETAENLGIHVDLEAREYTAAGIAAALLEDVSR